MIGQKKVENRSSRIDRAQGIGFDFHAFHDRRTARRSEIRASLDLDDADAAGGAAVFHMETVHFEMA